VLNEPDHLVGRVEADLLRRRPAGLGPLERHRDVIVEPEALDGESKDAVDDRARLVERAGRQVTFGQVLAETCDIVGLDTGDGLLAAQRLELLGDDVR